MSRASAEVGSAANSYEILAKLAMGGMAEIFLARGASTAGVERYVVLKRVLRHRATDESFIRMFLDEARLAAQLQHPNIAQVYDIGKLGDSYFFTMEYVHGETVRTLLQRSHALRRPIPISSTLTVMAGAAGGLHHAHERNGMDGRHLGIVHRDVSPSNLMVSYEGTVKVVDFGVAKAAHRDTETRSGTVKGKITYMSPEQCRGGDIDRRSDLFSLGIVMWEMLTTERLFRRNSDFDNMQAIVAEEVLPPSSLRPEVPPAIDAIVMKLLAKRPADRYQTADEVQEDIENAAVSSGSALSSASLGRFMRELFGQRPEPWIELQSNESHPEAFTVTSEPISPSQLLPSPENELDVKLASIPQLTQRLNTQGETPPHIPIDRPLQPTVPLRVQAEDLNERQSQNVLHMPPRTGTPPAGIPSHPSHPTLPMPASSPPPATMQSYTPSQSAQLAQNSTGPVRSHRPSLTPQSSPQYPVLSSHAAASYGTMGHAALQQPPTSRRSRALIILLPAVAIGVILGIVLAVGGKDKPKASEGETTVEMTPGPMEGSGAAATDTDLTAPEVTPPDVGSAAAGAGSDAIKPADTKPADIKPADTKPADTKPADTKPADTKPADTKPDDTEIEIDDTKPADTKPADTKPADTKPADTKPADTKPADTKPVEKRPPPPPRDDVATLFRAGKYSDVVSQCNGSSRTVSQNSTTCTLAACKTRDTTKAKRWLMSVSASKRSGVIKDCGGVLLGEKPNTAADDCKRDPLACQH